MGVLSLTLDAITFAPVDVFAGPGPYTYITQQHSQNHYVYTFQESLFELTQLQDHVVESYSQPKVSCNDPHQEKPTPLQDHPAQTITSSGLHFKVEMHVGRSGQSKSVILTAKDED
ncbi:hypothetical protein BGZ50_001441, partial [Haplosporangium sp. Z 11]